MKKVFLFSKLAGVGWENNLDPVFQDGALICVAIFLRSTAQPFLASAVHNANYIQPKVSVVYAVGIDPSLVQPL